MLIAQGLLPRKDGRTWRISDFFESSQLSIKGQSLRDQIATVKLLKAVFDG